MSAGRLVLVDDDAAARRMMRRVLERWQFEVHEAGDGAAGLELTRAQRPDLVLLDLRMPGELSGLDVARLLREGEDTNAIPIVIVSASTHMAAREMTLELGCDAFVEKPVDFDELRRTIDGLLSEC